MGQALSLEYDQYFAWTIFFVCHIGKVAEIILLKTQSLHPEMFTVRFTIINFLQEITVSGPHFQT